MCDLDKKNLLKHGNEITILFFKLILIIFKKDFLNLAQFDVDNTDNFYHDKIN